MKSSYKLFGTFWDNRPIVVAEIQVLCKEARSNTTFIELTKILGREEPEENKFDSDKTLALFVDYLPLNKSKAVMEFYIKRVLQIACYYNVSCIVCNEESEAVFIENAIFDFLKRKTPNELLAQSNGALQMIC